MVYDVNGGSFNDTTPNPSSVPTFNGKIGTDPTVIPEIESAIIEGYKDELAMLYAQFIREKMYGADVRESIARFGLWLDVRTNSVESKGNQINLEYQEIQKELEDFRKQFEIVISSETIDGEVKLARHSLFSGKTYPSLQVRLDDMEFKQYRIEIGNINTARTLIDNNFSKNHTVTKIGEVENPTNVLPIVVAEIDDPKQNRFKFIKVGEM